MNLDYNDLISKTFCEDSIRSVMMIDDDFLSYSQCSEKLREPEPADPEILIGTQRASDIVSFFHEKKILCDVGNDASSLNIDKIRKCDLLLLDYHLEASNPKLSLEILEKLKDSKHMNLVVIYTSESLDKVWHEVACTLRGSRDVSDWPFDDEAQSAWDDLTSGGSELPQFIEELVSNRQEVENYILKGKFSSEANRALGGVLRKNTSEFMEPIGEWLVSESNLLSNHHRSDGLKGEEAKWMKIGNVFVSFYHKTTTGDDPVHLWSTLEYSLHNWQPNYYRLILSQIQNHIEDQNIAMGGFLEQDYEGQAAWLWKLYEAKDNERLRPEFSKLCSDIYEEMLDTLLSDDDLYEFSENAIEKSLTLSASPELDVVAEAAVVAVGEVTEATKVAVKAAEDAASVVMGLVGRASLIEACKGHTSEALQSSPGKIAHALNQQLSSKKFTKNYLTVGSVVQCKDDHSLWYLCVSPSCDTVPKQHTNNMAKRMKPHRQLKFFKLNIANMNKALAGAETGKYLFVTNKKNERIALVAVHEETGMPDVDFGVVKNHDEGAINSEGVLEITLVGDDEGKLFSVVTQLREYYSARYQALASHSEGRIGVDFFPYSHNS